MEVQQREGSPALEEARAAEARALEEKASRCAVVEKLDPQVLQVLGGLDPDEEQARLDAAVEAARHGLEVVQRKAAEKANELAAMGAMVDK